MRLIDADALKQDLRKYQIESLIAHTEEKNVFDIINEQPTAYDVEKVLGALEHQAEQYRNRGFEHEQLGYSLSADKYYGKQCSYLHAIDIVRKGGVE